MSVIAKALALAGVPFLLSADLPAQDPRINSGMPPERFRGEAAAIVFFVNDVDAVCGKAPPGYTKLGCQWEKNGVPYIAVGNPCAKGDVESFARLACHEKAHSLGWSGDHEQ